MNTEFTAQDQELLDDLYAGTFCQVHRVSPGQPLYVRAFFAGTMCFSRSQDLNEHCQPVEFAQTNDANEYFIREAERDVLRNARAICNVRRIELS